MSKITTNNPVLQRNGAKISFILTINKLQIIINKPKESKKRNLFNINDFDP